ncbi:hypothetical protein CLU79DRAFT_721405 [Phycomyces nitens]|nr:hypothetical protein CLU79DRAFT_721405 [Phycomyces nitens]
MDKITLTCNNQINATTKTVQKTREDTANIENMIRSLREQDQALQMAFERIDQLESIIQTVKDTYNKVAESVDTIEKAVAASHRPLNSFPISFGLTFYVHQSTILSSSSSD